MIPYKYGHCKNPECAGNPEVPLVNNRLGLCAKHEQQRRNNAARAKMYPGGKLKKRNYVHHKRNVVKNVLIKRKRLPESKDTRAALEAKLDSLHSLYIRTKYSIDGYAKCYTCPTNLPIAQMQAGHFESRRNHAIRWEISVCRPQCAECNMYHHGRKELFRENLIAEIGIEKVERIERMAKYEAHYSLGAIKDTIRMFKEMLRLL